MAAATRVYALAPRFVFDHWSRDFPEDRNAISRKVQETRSRVYVELDDVGYEELLADATYYATEMGDAGFDDRGLISSARSVAAALKQGGTPSVLPPPPETLSFECLSPGVYDSRDGRVTLYRIEGVSPAAWNVEWTIDYGNRLTDLSYAANEYGPAAIQNELIVDGAASFRDAKVLAARAWPALRDRLVELEGGN